MDRVVPDLVVTGEMSVEADLLRPRGWQGETLAEIVRTHAATRPLATAFHFPDDHVSYRTLDAAATRVAIGLRSLGVTADERVAFLAKTSRQYFEVLLGAAKIGAVTVPINWRLAPREIGMILCVSDATIL